MAWKEGRKLSSLTTSSKTTSYTYDQDGIRVKKTNPDGTYVTYFVVDGKTVGERHYSASGTTQWYMRYTFDENDSVCGLSYRTLSDTSWTYYYFVKNLQGDVLAVYKSADNTKVAAYTYDSWGNILSSSGTFASVNPFRYRGYYYDAESGFYYLQSRYYDPAIGRFINADEYASTGQSFVGYNMFVYCGNNPVSNEDSEGTFFTAVALSAAAVVIGFIAGRAIAKENQKEKALLNGSGENAVTYGPGVSSNETRITNSKDVWLPWNMYNFCLEANGGLWGSGDYRGNVNGMFVEWAWHNVMYYGLQAAGSVLAMFGKSSDKILRYQTSAREVDFGETIFDDNHVVFSQLM